MFWLALVLFLIAAYFSVEISHAITSRADLWEKHAEQIDLENRIFVKENFPLTKQGVKSDAAKL